MLLEMFVSLQTTPRLLTSFTENDNSFFSHDFNVILWQRRKNEGFVERLISERISCFGSNWNNKNWSRKSSTKNKFSAYFYYDSRPCCRGRYNVSIKTSFYPQYEHNLSLELLCNRICSRGALQYMLQLHQMRVCDEQWRWWMMLTQSPEVNKSSHTLVTTAHSFNKSQRLPRTVHIELNWLWVLFFVDQGFLTRQQIFNNSSSFL